MLSKNLRKLGFALALAGVITTGVVTAPSYEVKAQETAVEITDRMHEVYNNRSLGLKKIKNARQLGGCVTKDGRKVKQDVLLRTGALISGAGTDDLEVLKNKYNLTKVIDFRDSIEKKNDPDPQIPGVSIVDLKIFEQTPEYLESQQEQQDLFNSAKTPEEGIPIVIKTIEDYNIMDPDMYVKIVTSTYSQKQYAHFFEEIVNNPGGAVLFHCAQGKDRTGLAAIFLLSALGVDKDTIMEDFLLTNVYFEKDLNDVYNAVIEAGAKPSTVEAARYYCGVSPDFMEKALNVIDEQYGSMDSYLRNQLGLTESDIQTLQDKYLD